MTEEMLSALPARRGHFLLESGYHTDLWLTLDALFREPHALAPSVAALADRLRPHAPTAICGPLLGGALLAHALATQMGLRFYFSEQVPGETGGALYTTRYRLPSALRQQVGHERVALVDDVISAGSSVRATAAALTAAGAELVAVGTLLCLGEQGEHSFTERGVPFVTLARQPFTLWAAGECPLCRAGLPLENPTASHGPEGADS